MPFLTIFNYVGNIFFNTPYLAYSEYKFEEHRCISRPFDDLFTFLRYYASVWSFEAYLIPGLGLLYFNVRAIRTLRKSDQLLVSCASANKTLGLKNKASILLLKTSTVSLSYYLTMSYVTYFYITQSLEGSYDTYDIRNIIGSGLATVHFSLNPIIALFFLPGIRRSSVGMFTVGKVEIL